MRKTGRIERFVIGLIISYSLLSAIVYPISADYTSPQDGLSSTIYRKEMGYADGLSEGNHPPLKDGGVGEPYGIWIYTQYNGTEKYTKLEMSLIQFIYTLLHPSYGIPVSIDVDDDGAKDVKCTARVYITSLSSVSPGIKSVLTTEIERRLEGELLVSLDVHIPLILSGNYISLKSGFYSIDSEPSKFDMGFAFSLFSQASGRIFKFDFVPDYSYEGNLTTLYSYEVFTTSGQKLSSRSFEVHFMPATELHITTIPRDLKVHYSFGKDGGAKTHIVFRSYIDGNPNKIHTFTIDPLPSYMSFDLSVLGGEFIYESDRSFDVTYSVESVENNTPIKLELIHVPSSIEAKWGAKIGLLPLSIYGFADLSMSDNIDEINLYINNSEEPFMSIKNFPRKLRVEGFMNIILQGKIALSKYSGSPTEISATLYFKNWKIDGLFTIKDGSMSVKWGIPYGKEKHAFITFDTNNKDMLGANITVLDVKNGTRFLVIGFDGVATDDFGVSWDSPHPGAVSNFKWKGKITKLTNLRIYVYHEGYLFNISCSWTIGKEGSFFMKLNRDVNVTFANVSSDKFKLYGYVSLYGNRKIKIDWEWGDTGHFTIYTFNKAIGRELQLEFGYGEKENDTYRYGFKLIATDFLNITRTIQWDTVNGIVPRIWILGDKPLPKEWSAWLLWNYKWYEVV